MPGLLGGMAYHLELKLQRGHASDLHHRHPRQNNHHSHFENKLKKVRDQHSPQSADGGVNAGKGNQHQNADQQRRITWVAQRVMKQRVAAESELDNASLLNHRSQQHSNDAYHGVGDPAQDQAIHEQPEINRLESAQKGRRLAAVADFREFYVSENFSPSPVAGKVEHRHHSADAEAPPEPISCNSLGSHHTGDK